MSDEPTARQATDGDPAWDRLEDQVGWYDQKSASCQRAYKWTKTAQLILGSAVPVLALMDARPVVTALVAAVVVVLEGVQQLNQWQSNWVLYRSTAEALKHERFLYLSSAGPYRGENSSAVLAERVEGLVSQEHAKWTDARQQPGEDRRRSPTADS